MGDRQIYLDHNATTPLHPEVIKAMSDAMEVFGNPSSLHEFGRPAKQMIENAREKIGALVNSDPEDIVFVGSGSEANNTVLSVMACQAGECRSCGGSNIEIITTSIEHPCVLETAKCLRERGIKVTFLEVDSFGKIDTDKLVQSITDKTRLVSIMMANNEIGTIQDIKSIAEIVHAHGALFHTDAVQAVGKIPVDVKDLDVDFLTCSAHKIYGPKGIGALYIKKGVLFCPLVHGGHQEKGRRAGTENTIGIAGFGKAAEMRMLEMPDEEKRLRDLRDVLKKGIEDNVPDVQFNGHPTDCVPNTLNVSFDGIEGEAILLYLDLEGIAVSTGSACASGSLDPSHVLLATGMSMEHAHGSLRISLGRQNTIEDIEYVLEKLPNIVEKTRRMSTAYSGS